MFVRIDVEEESFREVMFLFIITLKDEDGVFQCDNHTPTLIQYCAKVFGKNVKNDV